jgi:hypothetical protein
MYPRSHRNECRFNSSKRLCQLDFDNAVKLLFLVGDEGDDRQAVFRGPPKADVKLILRSGVGFVTKGRLQPCAAQQTAYSMTLVD